MTYDGNHEEISFKYESQFFSCKKNRMFQLLSKVWESKELHHVDVSVFLLIAATCNYSTQQCKYNIPMLAKIAKMDKSNFYKSIERLSETDIITVRQQFGKDMEIYLNFNYASEGTKVKQDIFDFFGADDDIVATNYP